MDFIDDVDLKLALGRRKIDFVAQVAHIIHAGVGCGVNLDQVEKIALIDTLAVLAVVAGAPGRVFVQAVDRLGQQARHGRLASAARPGKEVSMPHPVGTDGILESLNDMFLSNHLVPQAGPPFSIKCLCHGLHYPLTKINKIVILLRPFSGLV